jgi:hydrogenase expression/formation protein HypC
MCLGIPARIVELLDHPDLAIADVFGAKRKINVGLLEEGVVPGEWVMLHVGFAIEKLDAHQVEMATASLDLLGAGSDDLAGLATSQRSTSD